MDGTPHQCATWGGYKMELNWGHLADELEPHLKRGELQHCIEQTSAVIRSLPQSDFHQVLALEFTNDPAQIASCLDDFFLEQSQDPTFSEIGVGMNGFYINPDRWFFHIAALSADSTIHNSAPITLTGMESLQQVYKQSFSEEQNKIMETTRDYCDLLIVFKYIHLIYRSLSFIKHVNVRIHIGAHEYVTLVYHTEPR